MINKFLEAISDIKLGYIQTRNCVTSARELLNSKDCLLNASALTAHNVDYQTNVWMREGSELYLSLHPDEEIVLGKAMLKLKEDLESL